MTPSDADTAEMASAMEEIEKEEQSLRATITQARQSLHDSRDVMSMALARNGGITAGDGSRTSNSLPYQDSDFVFDSDETSARE